MEMLCPECQGALTVEENGSARCTGQGQVFQILFTRWQAPPPPEPEVPPLIEPQLDNLSMAPSAAAAASNTCAFHPHVSARYACRGCAKPICETCAFTEATGSRYCPECMTRRSATVPPLLTSAQSPRRELPPPAGARCRQHPHIAATRTCKLCGGFMCVTCDFALPDGVHVCPACAAAPNRGLSPRRKKFLIASLCLAAWSTLVMAVFLSGALAGAVQTEADQAIFGWAFILLVLIPSATGLSMGVSARNRRLENPPLIIISIVWNAIIVAGFLLLCIIGSFAN